MDGGLGVDELLNCHLSVGSIWVFDFYYVLQGRGSSPKTGMVRKLVRNAFCIRIIFCIRLILLTGRGRRG